MDTAQQQSDLPQQTQPPQPIQQTVPPVSPQPSVLPQAQPGQPFTQYGFAQKKHLPKGWSLHKERGPMPQQHMQETPAQKPQEQVVIASQPAIKETKPQEIIQPASEMHMPEVAKEVQEAGVEVKSEDIIQVPQDQQAVGVVPAKDATPVVPAQEIIEPLPMNEVQVVQTLKTHPSVFDAARWFAMLVGRQWQILRMKQQETSKEELK